MMHVGWRTVAASLVVAVAGFAGGCAKNITDADITAISLTGLRKSMDTPKAGTVLLIDARGPAEFQREHIPGAVNRPLDTFTGKSGDVDTNLSRYGLIAVYGNNPGSAPAKAVVKRMLASGYGDVYFYAGGLEEWRRSGLPTDRTEPVSAVGATGGSGSAGTP